MELCKTLVNKGITVISVLHDINFALNYSDKILIMKNGEVRGFGDTGIISSELIREVFEQEVEFINHNGKIIVIPK
jgi:ABC-type cobalamin/Fe3+-siderophores transport systems, ATPase components